MFAAFWAVAKWYTIGVAVIAAFAGMAAAVKFAGAGAYVGGGTVSAVIRSIDEFKAGWDDVKSADSGSSATPRPTPRPTSRATTQSRTQPSGSPVDDLFGQ